VWKMSPFSSFGHFVVIIYFALRDFLLGERNVIVEVEVAAERRHPLEAPAHALFVSLEFRQRRSRDRQQRHVIMLEVRERAVDVIAQERTARATLLPIRTEHEMIEDQLTASVEEIGQRLFALRAVEDILLVDLDSRQLATLVAKRVSLMRELLLLF